MRVMVRKDDVQVANRELDGPNITQQRLLSTERERHIRSRRVQAGRMREGGREGTGNKKQKSIYARGLHAS